jgi:hypothetical protein
MAWIDACDKRRIERKPSRNGDLNVMNKILNALAITVVVGLLAAAGFGVWILTQANKLTNDSNAVGLAAEMIVHHLKANGDEWPRSWEELRRDYQACVKDFDPPPTFDEVRSRVCVDWSMTSELLAQLAIEGVKPNSKVIWLCDGSNVHWRGAEPNRYVLNHFYRRATTQSAMHT